MLIQLLQINPNSYRLSENEVVKLLNPSADLIVLPEFWLTPFKPSDVVLNIKFAENFLKPFLEFHEQYPKTTICTGSAPIMLRGQVFNTAFTIGNNNGKQIVAQYSKTNLFEPMQEPEVIRPGRDCINDTIPVQPFTIAEKTVNLQMAICYDLRFPHIFTANKGGLTILPAQWPLERHGVYDSLLRARAVDNNLLIVSCNAFGRSRIYGPGNDDIFYDDNSQNSSNLVEIDANIFSRLRPYCYR